MELTNMTTIELEERRSAIAAEVDAEGADLTALEAEIRAINAELENRRAAAAKKAELRSMIAGGAGQTTETHEENEEERNMDQKEIRNSAKYIDAYANYIKTGKDDECRALLSTNGTSVSLSLTGYVPVPDLVDEVVRTAWEKNNVLSLVRKTYLKGNVKVGFELSADGAVVHAEGADAPNEEVITLGIVTMVPQSIKKWITVSDEALDLAGEAFLRYIYEEITYQIAKKAEAELIDLIAALPDTATTTSVSAANIAAEPSLTTIADALGAVVGSNMTIVMNRGTWATFKAVQYAANFPIDVFEGQNVVFTEALPAYGDADEEDVYAIVGDFYEGAQANFPNGEEITVKMDDLSLAEKDLVKFVGREYVGLGAVADKRFALLSVPENP